MKFLFIGLNFNSLKSESVIGIDNISLNLTPSDWFTNSKTFKAFVGSGNNMATLEPSLETSI